RVCVLAGSREIVRRERHRPDGGALVGCQDGSRVEAQRRGDLLRAEHGAVEGAHGVIESGGPQEGTSISDHAVVASRGGPGMLRALRARCYLSRWARATSSSRPKVS